jgi:hypothetical protein
MRVETAIQAFVNSGGKITVHQLWRAILCLHVKTIWILIITLVSLVASSYTLGLVSTRYLFPQTVADDPRGNKLEPKRAKPEQVRIVSADPAIRPTFSWIRPIVHELEAEGLSAKHDGRIRDFVVAQVETRPFEHATVPFELNCYSPREKVLLSGLGFRIHSFRGTIFYEPLPIRYEHDPGSPRISVSECEAGDSLLLLIRVSSSAEDVPESNLKRILVLEVK